MIVYLENPNTTTKKLIALANEIGEEAVYKINVQVYTLKTNYQRVKV